MHDLEVLNIIQSEHYRQRHTLRMIASENEPSDDVRYALGSCFMSKYCEGYPGKRYYQGLCGRCSRRRTRSSCPYFPYPPRPCQTPI